MVEFYSSFVTNCSHLGSSFPSSALPRISQCRRPHRNPIIYVSIEDRFFEGFLIKYFVLLREQFPTYFGEKLELKNGI